MDKVEQTRRTSRSYTRTPSIKLESGPACDLNQPIGLLQSGFVESGSIDRGCRLMQAFAIDRGPRAPASSSNEESITVRCRGPAYLCGRLANSSRGQGRWSKIPSVVIPWKLDR